MNPGIVEEDHGNMSDDSRGPANNEENEMNLEDHGAVDNGTLRDEIHEEGDTEGDKDDRVEEEQQGIPLGGQIGDGHPDDRENNAIEQEQAEKPNAGQNEGANPNADANNAIDEADDYSDWAFPANIESIELEDDFDLYNVWQCVKRPWQPKDYQLAPRKKQEKDEKAKKEALQGPTQQGTDTGPDEEDNEPGDDPDGEKFHYYWRLSNPAVYHRAGTAGQHWRAIDLRSDAKEKCNAKSIGWIKEQIWRSCLNGKKNPIKVPVYMLVRRQMVQTTTDLSSIKYEDKGKPGLTTEEIRGKIMARVLKMGSVDQEFLKAAQDLVTEKEVLKVERAFQKKKNLMGGVPELLFQNEDHTFTFGLGALKESPTVSQDKASKEYTDHIYVKLRRKHMQLLQVTGGTYKPSSGDTFILKSKLDELAGMLSRGPDLDPTRTELADGKWKSDKRQHMANNRLSVYQKRAEQKRQDADTRPQRVKDKEIPKDVKFTEEKSVWVRNAYGFAFQLDYKGRPADGWKTTLREAIGTLDEDRGWSRYIDPPIPLYILPCSPNSADFMRKSVLQTMHDLKMSKELLTPEKWHPKPAEKSLPKLPDSATATPDCATTVVHLIETADLKKLHLVKLAISPFGHYETWITQDDWKSYVDSRKGRDVPAWAVNETQIEKAKDLIKEFTGALEVDVSKNSTKNSTGGKNNNNKSTKNGPLKRGQQKDEVNTRQSKLVRKQEQKSENRKEKDYLLLSTQVTSSKIRDAKGTRKKATGQATVMGCSATEVAEVFDWKDFNKTTPEATEGVKWPATSHKPSEWLHRCAYSWGGLDGKDPASSQHKKNLVFGTGECNSVMTRFEKAWQALVCREGDRFEVALKDKKKSKNAGGGILSANIDRENYSALFGLDESPNRNPKKYTVAQDMMENTEKAKLPSWLCYALEYHLIQNDFVDPLGFHSFKTVFYPWQRGFFTKFEQKLDEAVLDLAYTIWEKNNPDWEPKNVRKAISSDGIGAGVKKVHINGSQTEFILPDRTQTDSDQQSENGEDHSDTEMNHDIAGNTEGISDTQDFVLNYSQSDQQHSDQMNEEFKDSLSDDIEETSSLQKSDFTDAQIYREHSNPDQQEFLYSASSVIEELPKSNTYRMLDQTYEKSVPIHQSEPESTPYLSTASESNAKINDTDAEVKNQMMVEDVEEFGKVNLGASNFTPPGSAIPPTETRGVDNVPAYIEEMAEAIMADAGITNNESTSAMIDVWNNVNTPGPTKINGLQLLNAEVVVGEKTTVAEVGVRNTNAEELIARETERLHPLASRTNFSSARMKEQVPFQAMIDSAATQKAPTVTADIADKDLNFSKTGHKLTSARGQALEKGKAISSMQSALMTREAVQRTEIDRKAQITSKDSQYKVVKNKVPGMFVIDGNYMLFGKHQVKISSLQAPRPGGAQHLKIDFPAVMSLGTFMPSLENSDFDMITLRNSALEYHSAGSRAGLSLKTTITFNEKVLPLVNSFLRDVFGQKDPRIDFTALLSSSQSMDDCLRRVPQPLGFTFRGELPDVNIPDLFGVLTVTHLGIDIMGRRLGSSGEYELGYSFLGRGRIKESTFVQWKINKFGKSWNVAIYTESNEWKNVGGIVGVDLKNVFLQAAWEGTKLSTVQLSLSATFSIKEQAQLVLAGKFGRNDFEVQGCLTDCSLTTLKQIYNQTFKTDIDVTTEHDIVLEELVLTVSKDDGIILYGQVSVDGHVAEATIHIGGGSIKFKGAISGELPIGDVKVQEPSLDMSIHTSGSRAGSGFEVKFSGSVTVNDKHEFDVLVYLNKRSGSDLEYTLYGSYKGDFFLHNLMDSLKDSNLLGDIAMRRLAICVSNMDDPSALIEAKPSEYKIGRGLTVYAEIDLPVICDVLSISKDTSLVVSASYRPPSADESSRFQIAVRVPQSDAFKISNFSIGDLALTVTVVDAKPSINIHGALEFPIEDKKKLTLGLDLSAGLFEASGQAKLTSDPKNLWVNPFGLCKEITIKSLRLGLNIEYATGTPSKITIGGALIIGEVEGSVVVHTGVDPTKQLLIAEIYNLDVAKFLKTIGKLIDVDMTMPGGKNAFFVEVFRLYVSTGFELHNDSYPRGIELKIDMMLFGKHVTLDGKVTTGQIVLKGSIEKFKVGEVEVCAASGADQNPYIDVELSKDVQRIKIDGKIIFMDDNWVMLLVDIDSKAGTFHLNFELVIGDALKIIVVATLEGELPEAPQDRIVETKDKTIGNKPTDQSVVKQVGQNLMQKQLDKISVGGQLEGKTFKIHATVEDRIVEYLVALANDHLGGERHSAKENDLEYQERTAKAALDAATVNYGAKKAVLDAAVKKVAEGLKQHLAELVRSIESEQVKMVFDLAKLDEEERIFVLESEKTMRSLELSEAAEVARMDEAARGLHVELEERRRSSDVLQTAENNLAAMKEIQDATEKQLAAVHLAVLRHARKEPERGPNDPTYAAWQWQHDELVSQVPARQISVDKALEDVEAAKSAITNLQMPSLEEALAKLEELVGRTNKADADAEARRAAANTKFLTALSRDVKKQMNMQEKRKALKAHVNKNIGQLADEQVKLEQMQAKALDDAKAKHDIRKTEEGKAYDKYLEMYRAAVVKLRAYRQLKSDIASAGDEVLVPLRFAVNVAKKASPFLLVIDSFVLDGQFTGKSSKVAAKVKAKVGGYAFEWNFSIDLGDIVSFFTELWTKLKNVLSSVANALLKVAREGIDAVKKFATEAANTTKLVVEVTSDAFMKELAACEKELEPYLADIDREVLKPYRKLKEVVQINFDKIIEGVRSDLFNQIRGGAYSFGLVPKLFTLDQELEKLKQEIMQAAMQGASEREIEELQMRRTKELLEQLRR